MGVEVGVKDTYILAGSTPFGSRNFRPPAFPSGHHPRFATTIGATKMYQLHEALGAVDLVLSANEITRLEASYRPHAVKGHESCA
jgi:hypothetical protein